MNITKVKDKTGKVIDVILVHDEEESNTDVYTSPMARFK